VNIRADVQQTRVVVKGISMVSAGECIAGRYRLECPLGEGGMGSVWRARHLELDTPVAIKFQHAHRTHSKGAAARFRREARAAARLRSPHVVRVVDFGFDSGVPYLAMELLEGESLKARLERKLSPTIEEALEFTRQVASALDAAHGAGIVHRDLKPSNLFVVEDGQREVIKLLDFGIAKWFEAEHATEITATEENLVLGSAAYMSPEQARGESVDRRSDVWSLGVVAYEMLVGITPFSGANIPDTLRKICSGSFAFPSRALGATFAAFDPVFAIAFELDTELRFASAGALSEALSDAGSTLGKDARGTSATHSTGGWAFGRQGQTLSASVAARPHGFRRARRNNVVLAAAAGSIVTLLVGVRVLTPSPVNLTAAAALSSPRPPPAGATSPALSESLPAPAPSAEPGQHAQLPGTPSARVRNLARRPEARPKPEPARPASSPYHHSRLDPVFGLEVPVPR
jgi:serine/threonine protein kinase